METTTKNCFYPWSGSGSSSDFSSNYCELVNTQPELNLSISFGSLQTTETITLFFTEISLSEILFEAQIEREKSRQIFFSR